MRSRELVLVGALLTTFGACGDDGGTPIDAAPEDVMDDGMPDANTMPMSLFETGLCADAECTTLSAGVFAFAPRYELYSDTATKRRWFQLPPGTQIDTTDMNYWRFPVGTKMWKEFTRGTTRVETRLVWKIGADDMLATSWVFASFKWDNTNNTTTLVPPNMGEMNANGTEHDIPTRSNCRRCHEGVPGRILGVNALSLDYTATEGLDLADLVAMDLLTVDPAAPSAAGQPHFPLPGTDVDKAAYGFMHANCGGCHNPNAPVFGTLTSNMVLRMDTTKLATVAGVPARATTIGNNGTISGLTGPLVTPNSVGNSVVMTRLNSLVFPTKMPEIGTETLNTAGIDAVTAWINQPP